MTHLMITIGPATVNDEAICKMLSLGVRLFRFPASKLDFDSLASQAAQFRLIANSRSIDIQCFVDLPGSKPRFTARSAGFCLQQGNFVTIAFEDLLCGVTADLTVIGMSLKELYLDVGDLLLVGDGENALEIINILPNYVEAVPLMTSKLGKARGVTISGKHAHHESLSSEDIKSLKSISGTYFDGAIISFCESPNTLDIARRLADDHSKLFIAKIETAKGVESFCSISLGADAVLLGRGDLLLDVGELAFYESCCRVIESGKHVGIPVIIGTQIMTSLSTMWLPNRSELAYACHLIENGISGIMLSNETTVGASSHRTVELLMELTRKYGNEDYRILQRKRALSMQESELEVE